MDELDVLEREVDNAKEALASKLAVILFMECKARIDDWSDRELMSRLALVLSLEEVRDEVEEESDDGGVDSKLAVILLRLIKVDTDEDMEVFATLDVAMAAAVVAAAAASAAASAAAAAGAVEVTAATVAATLRAALILFCFLRIAMPSRKTSFKSFICRMSSSLWCESGLSIFLFGAR